MERLVSFLGYYHLGNYVEMVIRMVVARQELLLVCFSGGIDNSSHFQRPVSENVVLNLCILNT